MDFSQRDFDPTSILMNNRPIEDFEGFSSTDMHYLVCNTFSPDSPFQSKKNIPDNIPDQITFLVQIEFLLSRINSLGELKLIAKGFLPRHL